MLLSRMRVAGCATLTTIAAALGAGVATGQDGLPGTPPLAPAITDIEADWVKGKIRLRTQVVPRGAKVEKVTLRYRKQVFKAVKGKQWTYSRLVSPRGGDKSGKKIHVKVRACTATVCATRSGNDIAD